MRTTGTFAIRGSLLHQAGIPKAWGGFQTLCPVRSKGGARFALDGPQALWGFDRDIHFVAGVVIPEVQVGGQAGVHAVFEQFTHDVRFGQGASGGVDFQGGGIAIWKPLVSLSNVDVAERMIIYKSGF